MQGRVSVILKVEVSTLESLGRKLERTMVGKAGKKLKDYFRVSFRKAL